MRDFSNDLSAMALNTATLGHILDGHGAGWETERVIDACAERGIGGIVFWRREIGEKAIAIGEQVRACGMQVAGLCRAPFLAGPLSERKHGAIMADFTAAIELAAAVGAPTLTVVTGGVEPGTRGVQNSLDLITERMAEAAVIAAQCNVKLALEPLHPVYGGDRSCLVTLRDAIDMCDNIDAENVGVAIDVYHVWWDTSLQTELMRAGAARIFGYHVCDWLPETRDVLLDRGMMGDGVADLKNLRMAVEAAGYHGFCEVEIFSAANWWLRAPDEVLDICIERYRSCC